MQKGFISIGTKLTILVLSVAIISIVIVTAFSFNLAETIIKNDVEESLRIESTTRGDAVSSIIENRIDKLRSLSNNQAIQETMSTVSVSLDETTFRTLLSESYPVLKDEIQSFQKNQLEAGLRDLKIINTPGRIVFSLDETVEPGTFAKNKFKVNKPTVDFVQDQSKVRLMKISIPIIYDSSAKIGTMTATMSSSVLDGILLNRYGLQESGEVYLVNKNNVMISESLFIENAEFNQVVNTVPVTQCFENGQNVDGQDYLDYRGVNIFGVSYCRSDLGFVLLTEVDEPVILNPVYDLQEKIIIVSGIIIASASAITIVLSRNLSRPILKLKGAAERISAGDFDVKTEIKTNDEIGQLSTSFDSMIKTIKETISAITRREDIIKRQENILMQFSQEKQDCCVCLVDIIGSLKITDGLSETQRNKYYEIFTGSILKVVKEFKGIPVKFINDAILFYFPPSGFDDVSSHTIDCCLKISEINKEMNDKMTAEDLPGIGYRISSTFGTVDVVHGDDVSIKDIFGEPVNLCFKINPYALPNTVIVGHNLYEKAKDKDFKFTRLDKSIIKELEYEAYITTRK